MNYVYLSGVNILGSVEVLCGMSADLNWCRHAIYVGWQLDTNANMRTNDQGDKVSARRTTHVNHLKPVVEVFLEGV